MCDLTGYEYPMASLPGLAGHFEGRKGARPRSMSGVKKLGIKKGAHCAPFFGLLNFDNQPGACFLTGGGVPEGQFAMEVRVVADIEVFNLLLLYILTGLVDLGLGYLVDPQVGTADIGMDSFGAGKLFGALHNIAYPIMGAAGDNTHLFTVFMPVGELGILVHIVVHPLAIAKDFWGLGDLAFKIIGRGNDPHVAEVGC